MIKTTCEKCIFKLEKDCDQYGCYVGKLDKFLENGDATKEKNYYTISRMCNSCRDTPKSSDLEEDAKLVNEENKTNFYLFINCCDNDIIPQKTIESLKSLEYTNLTVHFIFNSGKFVTLFSEINDLIDGDFKFRVSKIVKDEDVHYTITSTINQLDKNYFIGFVDCNNEIDNTIFEEINNKINKELNQLICYLDENMILIYNNMLSILCKQTGNTFDIDFYISSILAWAENENKMEMVWIKEYA